MSALIYREPKDREGRYLVQILDPHIHHNTLYPWQATFLTFFIKIIENHQKCILF